MCCGIGDAADAAERSPGKLSHGKEVDVVVDIDGDVCSDGISQAVLGACARLKTGSGRMTGGLLVQVLGANSGTVSADERLVGKYIHMHHVELGCSMFTT